MALRPGFPPANREAAFEKKSHDINGLRNIS
jgi:hypothetical protein